MRYTSHLPRRAHFSIPASQQWLKPVASRAGFTISASQQWLKPVASRAGFTIIEMLIATLVFTVVLLIVTTGILQFSRQYYKGVISSTTQGAARGLIDEVTRAIQFNSGGVVRLGTKGYCIGTIKRYSYELNRQVTDTGTLGPLQSRHALVSDTFANCNGGTTPLPVASLTSLSTPDARELLGPNMRLTKFNIGGGADGIYTVTVRVVYGDDDLLCSIAANDCGYPNQSPSVAANAPDLTCKTSAGAQFCAASELTTIVKKRVAL